ncbi:serine hydrolase [Nocardioides speluncae]|uniref:serine hydrolase n=1 Tax=Nocardioides speluncae TaxID=2670337 RepID=UPI000D68B4FD|nr:serine hydrolase [Nocardioides speluncae]
MLSTTGSTLRRAVSALLTLAVSLSLAALIGSGQQAAAVPAVPDPDRNSQVVTNWGWHYNVTPSSATGFVNQGYRIVDLEVRSSSPRFDVSYVKNSGTYARAWWWYYGMTPSQVISKLNTNKARLIDIEPYSTAAGTRYAVVMVKNSGSAAKAWGWHYNVPLSTITSYTSNNNMRVIDVDRHASGNRFSAIYIKNTGVDAKSWWHYYNVTSAQVSSLLSQKKARPINLERLSNGRFDVVMQKRAGEYWWWLHGVTATQVHEAANQFGARIFQVKGYSTAAGTRYHALYLGNVDAETRRVQNSAGSMTGKWGFYLKRVGGPTKLGIGHDNQFEPASMIKIVHAVTAMRDIQNNAATTTTTPVTWYAAPGQAARYPGDFDYSDDKNRCAYDSSGNLQTDNTYSDQLGPVIIKQTLQQSDNRTTDALTRRYGFAALNSTKTLAGMTKSSVNHRIGCDGDASPQPLTHNWLTLVDAGKIYERIQDTTLLNTGHRNLLYSYMSGGAIGNGSLKSMIEAEATAAGLSASERATFLSHVVTRSKGGSYGYCPSWGGSGADCNTTTAHSRTVGGTIWLPFKTRAGAISDSPYVYGRYWNAEVPCSFASVDADTCAKFNANQTGISKVSVEMFRAEVKKALATW